MKMLFTRQDKKAKRKEKLSWLTFFVAVFFLCGVGEKEGASKYNLLVQLKLMTLENIVSHYVICKQILWKCCNC